MSLPVVTTKLYVPSPQANSVSRQRLLMRLNEGLKTKFILVSAPAGFGKTTLLSEWVHKGRKATQGDKAPRLPGRVAWLSLDAGDNDLARFLTYLITALQKVDTCLGAGLLEIIQSPHPSSAETMLASLLNDLATQAESLVLILDDYHLIVDAQVDDMVRRLIERLPPTVHLVISTRADPPWPLACSRVRQELSEIRANELRFTPEEAADFLTAVMGLKLSQDDVADLENRTEGWIAGLQVAALSMQNCPETSDFIRSFTGSHRYIFDYLAEEILARQTPQINDFLLKTSILDRMCGRVCDALLEGEETAIETPSSPLGLFAGICQGSQATLEYLERANLFVVSLDDERNWYRYHHLFSDLLRSHLISRYPAVVPLLHTRASAWFEKHGYITDAVIHALAANDTERLVRLIENHAFTVMDVGEINTLLGWLDALPDEIVRQRPWLSITRAWILAYLGRLEPVNSILQNAEQAAVVMEGRDRLLGYIAAIRALAAELRVDVNEGIAQARRALDLLPAEDLRARAFAAYHMANLLSLQGDVTLAAQTLEDASTVSQAAGDVQMTVMVQCEIAHTWMHQGKLKKAARLFEHALKLAENNTRSRERKLLAVGIAYLQLSALYREWNDLPRALEYAHQGIRLCKSWGYTDYLYLGLTIYAAILRSAGEFEAALDVLGEARQTLAGVSAGSGVRNGAQEVLVHLASDNLPAAVAWLEQCGLSATDPPTFERRNEYFSLARVLARLGRYAEAQEIYAGLAVLAGKAASVTMALRVAVQQALTWQRQGRLEQALATLRSAVEMAAAEGYVCVFVEEGTAMKKLLHMLATAPGPHPYLHRLLDAFADRPSSAFPQIETTMEMAPSSPSSSSSASPSCLYLLDPLSQREKEVVQLLAAGFSNGEIAHRLVIADETVKKHLKNIYNKLDVHSRTAAVAQARQLGLL